MGSIGVLIWGAACGVEKKIQIAYDTTTSIFTIILTPPWVGIEGKRKERSVGTINSLRQG